MSNTVTIPANVWHEVCAFFKQIVSPCKECVRGNPVTCWNSKCAAFQFRPIARDVLAVRTTNQSYPSQAVPNYIKVEDEILHILAGFDHPIPPSALKLWTTNSKSVKSKAISRLVRRGRIHEERVNGSTRYISLPQKRNPNK